MRGTGADGHDILPAGHLTLTVIVITHSNHRAVRLQAYGMRGTGADGHDILPAGHITPTLIVITHSHHRAVCLQAYSVESSCRNGDDILPAGHITLTVTVITHSNHRAVRLQAYSVESCCRNGDDIRPGGHITLTIIVLAHSHHRAVRLQAYGMIASGDDGHDILPAGHSAPTVTVITHSNHRAVRLQAYSVESCCRNGDDIRPGGHITLTIIVLAHSHHRAVRLQAYGMIASGDDGHDILPAGHSAPTVTVITHSNHRAVRLQAYGMRASDADGIPIGHLIPQRKRPFPGILIIARLSKSDGSLFEFARIHEGHRIIVVDHRKDHRIQQNDKGNNGTYNGSCNDANLFPFLGNTRTLQPVGFFLFSGNLCFFIAGFSLSCRVAVLAYCFKQPCRFYVGVFRPYGRHRIFRAGIDTLQPVVLITGVDILNVAHQARSQRLIGKAHGLLIVIIAVEGLCLILKVLLVFHPQFSHQLSQVCLGIFRIHVQYLFAIFISTAPFFVLQKQKDPLQQRCRSFIDVVFHSDPPKSNYSFSDIRCCHFNSEKMKIQ